ncbi:hypothetical protein PGT21_027640 [Puccinia graminis f. sp. tritici]|uniref:Uncharacterized protein n=1 Tax=Puccinia graminis f. sp. tritici TaxID=56615 RepID=A0A5B0MVP0_PUCGR|nr:hypothetical protein PGT21_027640 [Puccinia graminis f. sp. tritici]
MDLFTDGSGLGTDWILKTKDVIAEVLVRNYKDRWSRRQIPRSWLGRRNLVSSPTRFLLPRRSRRSTPISSPPPISTPPTNAPPTQPPKPTNQTMSNPTIPARATKGRRLSS